MDVMSFTVRILTYNFLLLLKGFVTNKALKHKAWDIKFVWFTMCPLVMSACIYMVLIYVYIMMTNHCGVTDNYVKQSSYRAPGIYVM